MIHGVELKHRLVGIAVIVNAAVVLALTVLAFVCDNYLWLPSWLPFRPTTVGANLGLIAAFLLLLALAGTLWKGCSWLRSQDERRYAVALLVLLIPLALALARRPIKRALQLRAAHRACALIDALDGYVRDHGTAPRDLQELVPEYIHEVPTPGLSCPVTDQFIYDAAPPRDGTVLPFTLAFGLRHALGGEVAVVYYPISLPLQAPSGKQVVFRLSLPSMGRPEYFHEERVPAIRRLDESWVFAGGDQE